MNFAMASLDVSVSRRLMIRKKSTIQSTSACTATLYWCSNRSEMPIAKYEKSKCAPCVGKIRTTLMWMWRRDLVATCFKPGPIMAWTLYFSDVWPHLAI